MNRDINQTYGKNILRGSFAIITGILVTGCNSNISYSSKILKAQEDINIEKSPIEVVQKAIELSEDFSIFEDSLENKPQVKAVSFRELIEYLPQTPQGWQESKPTGQTTSFGDYAVSQVKQSYSKNNQIMTVSIFDWAFNSALYLPFLLATEFSQESTEGYNKGVKIDNIPGREKYDYQTKNGSLNLLVNRRFFVSIEGENIAENELVKWWQYCDRQSLIKASNAAHK